MGLLTSVGGILNLNSEGEESVTFQDVHAIFRSKMEQITEAITPGVVHEKQRKSREEQRLLRGSIAGTEDSEHRVQVLN